MVINEPNEKKLFAHCSCIIAKMPSFHEGSKNAVAASVYFAPLYDAYDKNELRAHLEIIELGLLDESAASTSKAGQDVISLYSRTPYSNLVANKKTSIGNYVRLILIRLTFEKIITLNSAFKISISSQGQFTTVLRYKQIYPSSVFESLAIGTPDRVRKHRGELPEDLLSALNRYSIAYKSRAGASSALARACLCQGVKTLSDFKFTDWHAFYTDYTSVPERPVIGITPLIKTIAYYNNDHELEDGFANCHKYTNAINTSNVVRVSGGRALAKALLGEVSYLSKGVRYDESEYIEYAKSVNRKVVSYGYWNNSEIKRSDFTPKNLNTEISKIWTVAQMDYCNSKYERGTKKNALLRLSVLNIYLFSYLPAYFVNSSKAEGVEFPRLPKDFISAIYVQRSSIFEHEAGLPDDFQFPVMLEDFVHAYEDSRSKINTKNQNTAKGTMRDISLFFDHLSSISSTDINSEFYIKNNPVSLVHSKIKGTKYLKAQKEVMSLTYWSGFRIFMRILANKLLDDNLAIVSGMGIEKDLSNYPINSKFNFFGSEVEIGNVDISDVGVYLYRISSERAVRLPNANNIAMLCFMGYSGQRLSNTFWLDVNTYSSLSNEDTGSEDDLVQVLINTDKVLTREFPIYIPRFTFNMLNKVETLLGLNKYHWSQTALYYQNEQGSKWGKITPLFRISEGHSYPDIQIASLLREYESCLAVSGIQTNESHIFYMPVKHIIPKEHIHCVTTGYSHINEITARVKYCDKEEVVQFTPIKKGTLITPHSLRVMISSVYSPALGEEAVSKLMTGQTEATVGYYTTELDSTSSDLIAHLSSLMNLKGKQLVSEATIDQDDFKRRLSEGTVEFDYQANSINFSSDGVFEDESIPSSGLSALRIAPASALAFNRTHICPFNNKCPRTIVAELGEHNCSGCTFTITTTNHIPSIAAEIRSKSESMKEIGLKLDSSKLGEIERAKLENERNKLLRDVTNWYVRLKVMNNNSNLFIMSADGKKRLSHDIPITSDTSSLQAFLRRLDEVNGSELLQTESLKIQSARFMRLAEVNINKMNWDSIPEFNDVDAAYSHFKTLCNVSSLDVKDTLISIENKFSHQQSITKVIGLQ